MSKAPKAPKAPKELPVAIISTSDRNAFRSCRRKWNWSSPLRQSLQRIEQAKPLWFGSGMHHALEDLHGDKNYPSIEAAIEDYYQATVKFHGAENLPNSAEESKDLMLQMAQHYQYGFLKARGRDPLKTYVVSGVPQVEISFEFEIPVSKELLAHAGYSKAVYKGTLDRVVVDDDGYLWIVDYKNVAAFTQYDYLELDSQIGVYLWAAAYIYKRPVLGFIYTQLRKAAVEPPRLLKNGTLSTTKDQNTSYTLYRKALIDMYGDTPNKWPEANIEALNHLASLEEPEADKFIRRDRVTRTQANMRSEAEKIVAEVEEMLNPDLPIYPNPSFMCPRMCSFMEPCLAKDRGQDVDTILEVDYYQQGYSERNEWRKYLKANAAVDKPIISVVGKVEDYRKPATKKSVK